MLQWVEFINREFETLLNQLGIHMERTLVHIPKQNDISERFNRSASQAIRSMLKDSSLK